jgi:hypothetical protein
MDREVLVVQCMESDTSLVQCMDPHTVSDQYIHQDTSLVPMYDETIHQETMTCHQALLVANAFKQGLYKDNVQYGTKCWSNEYGESTGCSVRMETHVVKTWKHM